MRHKVAIRFAIEGDLRFISHHDTMRLFERALSRAQLPVKFSEGFNPRPRLALLAPRAVGVSSEADVLVIELTEPTMPADILERLGEQMPARLTLTGAWALESAGTPRVDQVEYALALPGEHTARVAEALDRLRAAQTWWVKRSGPGDRPGKTVDLRVYLGDASIDEGLLRWTARVTNEGTLRPAELLSAVGLDPASWLHRVRRTSVHLRAEAATGRRAAPGRPTGE